MTSWTLSPPVHLGSYSVDRDHAVRLDRSNLKLLYDVNVGRNNLNINLDEGFDTYEDYKVPYEVGMGALCRWIMSRVPVGTDIQEAVQSDFVASRGILKKISVSCYSDHKWGFVVMQRNGVIFIVERKHPDRYQPDGSYAEHATYWGHKYEQCMQINRQGALPVTNQPILCGDEFRTVVSTKLTSKNDSLGILFCGEVDAVKDDGSFVELKTHVVPLNYSFWCHKSRDTFMQCKLLGIRELILGLRTREGVLTQVQSMSMESLENSGRAHWSSAQCVAKLASVLMDVKKTLKDNELCQYEFDGQLVKRVPVVPVTSQNDFLSEDFKKHFNIV